jgi:PAS domain S-box-containing protein
MQSFEYRDAVAALQEDLLSSPHVVAVFDRDLNYLFINDPGCRLLGKSQEEIVGHNMLDLFPTLTASDSHRKILQAFSGETVLGFVTEGTFTRAGAKYISDYFPVNEARQTVAVAVRTKTIYFPE